MCAIIGAKKDSIHWKPKKIKDSRNYLSNLNSTKSSPKFKWMWSNKWNFFLTFIYNILKYEYFIQNLKKIWFFKGPSIERIIENIIFHKDIQELSKKLKKKYQNVQYFKKKEKVVFNIVPSIHKWKKGFEKIILL